MKEQLVTTQLAKDSAEQLKAAAEDELKKTKADCDELKEQIADLQAELECSEANISSLHERIQMMKQGKLLQKLM